MKANPLRNEKFIIDEGGENTRDFNIRDVRCASNTQIYTKYMQSIFHVKKLIRGRETFQEK